MSIIIIPLEVIKCSTKLLWAYYIAGALIALFIKYASYIYIGKVKFGKRIGVSTKEWFIENTLANAASWFATVLNLAIAWTIGRIYINKIASFGYISELPTDIAFALVLGLLIEYIAPNVAKFIISKFPGGGLGGTRILWVG